MDISSSVLQSCCLQYASLADIDVAIVNKWLFLISPKSVYPTGLLLGTQQQKTFTNFVFNLT